MNDGTDAPSQAFVDAVRLTTERETASGRPWCPASESAAAENALRRRGIHLGGMLRQAVRLLRVMEAAGSFGYAGFLWSDMPSLETRNFIRLIGRAAADGRLAGIAEIAGSRGEPDRIVLVESAMAARSDAGFDLGFAQMPRLAALLDMVHNMLGFPAVAELASGVLGRRGTAGAEETARVVEDALVTWLAPNLASLHHQRAAGAMRTFLETRGTLSPDLVDDAVILDFWIAAGASADPVDGFRSYVSAARHMLAYRAALVAAAAEIAARRAAPIGSGGEDGTVDPDLLIAEDADADVWVSPLVGLSRDPAARAKWLHGTDRKFLGRIIEDGSAEEQDGTPRGSSLFSGTRPNARFALTILRAHHFGSEQERRRVGAPAAPRSENGYADVARAYAKAREDALAVAAAGALRLLSAGEAAGLLLAGVFAPDEVGEVLRGTTSDEEREVVRLTGRLDAAGMARVLSTHLAPRTSKAGVRMRAAAARITRDGFKEKDACDPAATEALVAGAVHLAALVEELSHLEAMLSAAAHGDRFLLDEGIFADRFGAMYGPAEASVGTA